MVCLVVVVWFDGLVIVACWGVIVDFDLRVFGF